MSFELNHLWLSEMPDRKIWIAHVTPMCYVCELLAKYCDCPWCDLSAPAHWYPSKRTSSSRPWMDGCIVRRYLKRLHHTFSDVMWKWSFCYSAVHHQKLCTQWRIQQQGENIARDMTYNGWMTMPLCEAGGNCLPTGAQTAWVFASFSAVAQKSAGLHKVV